MPTSVISGTSDDAAVSAGHRAGQGIHLSLPPDRRRTRTKSSRRATTIAFTASDAPTPAMSSSSKSTPTQPSSTPMSTRPAAPPPTTSNGVSTKATGNTGPGSRTAHSLHQRRDPRSASSPRAERGRPITTASSPRTTPASFTGGDNEFTTFAPPPDQVDSCSNAHVGSRPAPLFCSDCRAYELVSAEDTGGYNVESDLVPGQTPFGGYPTGRREGSLRRPQRRDPRALEPDESWRRSLRRDPRLRTAGRPNTSGSPPTSRAGPAGRSPRRWRAPTKALEHLRVRRRGDLRALLRRRLGERAAADARRRADQGNGGIARTQRRPGGRIVKRFSADGSHFLFGSTAKFETDANSNGTDTTIYDRDLDADTTQVVSKLPNGNTIANGRGSRGARHLRRRLPDRDRPAGLDRRRGQSLLPPLHARRVEPGDDRPDSGGDERCSLRRDDERRQHASTSPPATHSDRRRDQDTDTSADIYRADVGSCERDPDPGLRQAGAGPGGAGDTDACDPAGDDCERTLEHRRLDGRLQRDRDRRRRRRRDRERGPLLPLTRGARLHPTRATAGRGRSESLSGDEPGRRRISSRPSSRSSNGPEEPIKHMFSQRLLRLVRERHRGGCRAERRRLRLRHR